MKRGFTLIELLVVVLIIGILAAVALPQYNKAVEKSRMVEVASNINSIQKAMRAFLLTNPNAPLTIFTSSAGKELLDIDVFSNMDCTSEENTCMTKYFAYSAECQLDQCFLMIWRLNTPGMYEPASRKTAEIDMIFSSTHEDVTCYQNGPKGLLFCDTLRSFTTEDYE